MTDEYFSNELAKSLANFTIGIISQTMFHFHIEIIFISIHSRVRLDNLIRLYFIVQRFPPLTTLIFTF